MRIDPAQHGWMTAPETLAVMTALVEARFVGGAVRNALLGTPVVDIDIAVPMPPGESTARLVKAGIRTIPTGIDHGTVTALAGTHAFEVTSLRRDVETDGRHAVIAYTDDWAEDAARRDFTINALYADANGEIYDYATGVEDLIAGRVRFMGDPATRIAEDYLRVLRLFRFQAWYGRGEIDEPGLRAAAAAKDKFAMLSGERIAKEILRLLEAPRPGPALRVMAATGILAQLLPSALDLARLERLCELDAEALLPSDALLRLAALLAPADADAAADRLRLSNVQRARIADALGGGTRAIASHLSAQDVRGLLYEAGAQAFKDRVRLAWAAAPRSQSAIRWRMLLAMADSWERPHFPISGRDVMDAGVTEGAGVGRVLDALERWWAAEDFTPDDAALREKLEQLVRKSADKA